MDTELKSLLRRLLTKREDKNDSLTKARDKFQYEFTRCNTKAAYIYDIDSFLQTCSTISTYSHKKVQLFRKEIDEVLATCVDKFTFSFAEGLPFSTPRRKSVRTIENFINGPYSASKTPRSRKTTPKRVRPPIDKSVELPIVSQTDAYCMVSENLENIILKRQLDSTRQNLGFQRVKNSMMEDKMQKFVAACLLASDIEKKFSSIKTCTLSILSNQFPFDMNSFSKQLLQENTENELKSINKQFGLQAGTGNNNISQKSKYTFDSGENDSSNIVKFSNLSINRRSKDSLLNKILLLEEQCVFLEQQLKDMEHQNIKLSAQMKQFRHIEDANSKLLVENCKLRAYLQENISQSGGNNPNLTTGLQMESSEECSSFKDEVRKLRKELTSAYSLIDELKKINPGVVDMIRPPSIEPQRSLNKSSISPSKNSSKNPKTDIIQLEYSNLNMNHLEIESFEEGIDQQKVINELRLMVGELQSKYSAMTKENKYLQKKFELRHQEKIRIDTNDICSQTITVETKSVANSNLVLENTYEHAMEQIEALTIENEQLKLELDKLISNLDQAREHNYCLSMELEEAKELMVNPDLVQSQMKVQALKQQVEFLIEENHSQQENSILQNIPKTTETKSYSETPEKIKRHAQSIELQKITELMKKLEEPQKYVVVQNQEMQMSIEYKDLVMELQRVVSEMKLENRNLLMELNFSQNEIKSLKHQKFEPFQTPHIQHDPFVDKSTEEKGVQVFSYQDTSPKSGVFSVTLKANPQSGHTNLTLEKCEVSTSTTELTPLKHRFMDSDEKKKKKITNSDSKATVHYSKEFKIGENEIAEDFEKEKNLKSDPDNQKMRDLQSKLEYMNSLKTEVEHELEKSNEKIHHLEHQILTLTSQNEKVTFDMQKLSEQNLKQMQKNNELWEEFIQLQEKQALDSTNFKNLEFMQKEIEVKSKTIDVMETEIKLLKTEKTTIEDQYAQNIQNQAEQIEMMKQQIDKEFERNESLEKKFKDTIQKYTELDIIKRGYLNQIQGLKSSLNQNCQILNETEQHRIELETTITDLRLQIAELLSKNQRLSSSNKKNRLSVSPQSWGSRGANPERNLQDEVPHSSNEYQEQQASVQNHPLSIMPKISLRKESSPTPNDSKDSSQKYLASLTANQDKGYNQIHILPENENTQPITPDVISERSIITEKPSYMERDTLTAEKGDITLTSKPSQDFQIGSEKFEEMVNFINSGQKITQDLTETILHTPEETEFSPKRHLSTNREGLMLRRDEAGIISFNAAGIQQKMFTQENHEMYETPKSKISNKAIESYVMETPNKPKAATSNKVETSESIAKNETPLRHSVSQDNLFIPKKKITPPENNIQTNTNDINNFGSPKSYIVHEDSHKRKHSITVPHSKDGSVEVTIEEVTNSPDGPNTQSQSVKYTIRDKSIFSSIEKDPSVNNSQGVHEAREELSPLQQQVSDSIKNMFLNERVDSNTISVEKCTKQFPGGSVQHKQEIFDSATHEVNEHKLSQENEVYNLVRKSSDYLDELKKLTKTVQYSSSKKKSPHKNQSSMEQNRIQNEILVSNVGFSDDYCDLKNREKSGKMTTKDFINDSRQEFTQSSRSRSKQKTRRSFTTPNKSKPTYPTSSQLSNRQAGTLQMNRKLFQTPESIHNKDDTERNKLKSEFLSPNEKESQVNNTNFNKNHVMYTPPKITNRGQDLHPVNRISNAHPMELQSLSLKKRAQRNAPQDTSIRLGDVKYPASSSNTSQTKSKLEVQYVSQEPVRSNSKIKQNVTSSTRKPLVLFKNAENNNANHIGSLLCDSKTSNFRHLPNSEVEHPGKSHIDHSSVVYTKRFELNQKLENHVPSPSVVQSNFINLSLGQNHFLDNGNNSKVTTTNMKDQQPIKAHNNFSSNLPLYSPQQGAIFKSMQNHQPSHSHGNHQRYSNQKNAKVNLRTMTPLRKITPKKTQMVSPMKYSTASNRSYHSVYSQQSRQHTLQNSSLRKQNRVEKSPLHDKNIKQKLEDSISMSNSHPLKQTFGSSLKKLRDSECKISNHLSVSKVSKEPKNSRISIHKTPKRKSEKMVRSPISSVKSKSRRDIERSPSLRMKKKNILSSQSHRIYKNQYPLVEYGKSSANQASKNNRKLFTSSQEKKYNSGMRTTATRDSREASSKQKYTGKRVRYSEGIHYRNGEQTPEVNTTQFTPTDNNNPRPNPNINQPKHLNIYQNQMKESNLSIRRFVNSRDRKEPRKSSKQQSSEDQSRIVDGLNRGLYGQISNRKNLAKKVHMINQHKRGSLQITRHARNNQKLKRSSSKKKKSRVLDMKPDFEFLKFSNN